MSDEINRILGPRVGVAREDITGIMFSVKSLSRLSGLSLPMHLSKGALKASLCNRTCTLKDNLGTCRYVKPVALALDHLKRRSDQRTNVLGLRESIRQWHAGRHDSSWRNAKGQRPGHVAALLLPHLVHLPDVLRLDDEADEVVPVVDHCAGDGPVGPLAVWRLNNVHAIGLYVLATVGLMQQWRGKLSKIKLVRREAELLAGPGLDNDRRDRGSSLGRDHLIQDLLHR